MGKIRLYERQRLASSAVGTPGVSDAGDDIVRMGDREAALVAEQVKIEAAKIEIADNIEAEKYRIQFENQYYQNLEKSKQDNISNPFSVPQNAYEQGTSLASSMSQEIANPRVKEMFLSKAQKSVESFQPKLRDWASRTTTENAFVSLSDSMEALEAQAGQIRNASDIPDLVNSAEQLALNSATVVGVERANRVFEATRKGIYENFAYSTIDQNPQAVKTMVDRGVFNGVLDEKEQLQLKKSADSLIKKRESEIKLQNRSSHLDTVAALYEKEAAGSLTLKEVDNAIATFKRTGAGLGDLRSLYSIRKSLLGGGTSSTSGGRGSSSLQSQAETFVNLTDEYLSIFDKTGANASIMATPATYVTIDDLNKLQNKIISAADNKQIPKSSARAMLQNITRGKKQLMSNSRSVTSDIGLRGALTQGRLSGKTTKEVPVAVYNQAMRNVGDWANKNISDPKLRNEFKYEAVTSFVMQYDDVKNKKGFSMNAYTNQIIAHYARKYGKSIQLKKVK